MSNSKDKEFEQFLAGNSPVSQLYKKSPDVSPSAELDQRILQQAHKAVAHHHSYAPFSGRWVVPASFAAVIVLSISIIIQLPYDADLHPETVTTLGTQQNNRSANESQDAIGLDRFSIEKRQSEFSDDQEQSSRPEVIAPAETPAVTSEAKRKKAESMRPAPLKQVAPQLEKSRTAKDSLPHTAAEPAAAELMAEPVMPDAVEAEAVSAPVATDTGVAKEQQPAMLAEPVEESPAPMGDIRTDDARPAPEARQDDALSTEEQWLKKISKLLDEKNIAQAHTEYREFRKNYPAYHSHMTVEIEQRLEKDQ